MSTFSTGFPCLMQFIRSVSRIIRLKSSSCAYRIIQNTCESPLCWSCFHINEVLCLKCCKLSVYEILFWAKDIKSTVNQVFPAHLQSIFLHVCHFGANAKVPYKFSFFVNIINTLLTLCTVYLWSCLLRKHLEKWLRVKLALIPMCVLLLLSHTHSFRNVTFTFIVSLSDACSPLTFEVQPLSFYWDSWPNRRMKH